MTDIFLGFLTAEHLRDAGYWLAFLAGQLLFLLKRVGLAVRSPLNALRSRRQFFVLNADLLLVRVVLAFVLIYWPFRHEDTMVAWLGSFGSRLPRIPQAAIVAFLLGFLADSLIDWGTGHEKIFGIPVPAWLREQVPKFPEIQEALNTAIEMKKRNGDE